MPKRARSSEPRGERKERKESVPNKAARRRRAVIAASRETPLDYMLRVMHDETADNERRDEMAKIAAPYVHPRLSAIEHPVENAFESLSDDELIAELERLIAERPSSVEPALRKTH